MRANSRSFIDRHLESRIALLPRLAANEKIIREFNEQTVRVGKLRTVTPAAEWLLDNSI